MSRSVAACCSVLQYVAVCCRERENKETAETVSLRVLQFDVVCCSVLQRVAVCCCVLQCCCVLHYVAVCCSVLQRVAACCRI